MKRVAFAAANGAISEDNAVMKALNEAQDAK